MGSLSRPGYLLRPRVAPSHGNEPPPPPLPLSPLPLSPRLGIFFQELLVEAIVGRGAARMRAEGRATLEYKDIATAVAGWEALDFLADIVPPKVAAAAALERMKAR